MVRTRHKKMIKNIVDCSKQYEKFLADKNICFVYFDEKEKNLKCFETQFLRKNFEHFTGIYYKDPPEKFYYDCIHNQLSKKKMVVPLYRTDYVNYKMEILKNACLIAKEINSFGIFTSKKHERNRC